MANKPTVYWAGPLFTQAERKWNRQCAVAVTEKGYDVILPQDRASAFETASGMDFEALARDCEQQAIRASAMVCVLDGSDVDSGTSLEVGIRHGHRLVHNNHKPIVGLRTDFRASSEDNDVCVNAMFRLVDRIVFCTSTENHDELALQLVQALDELV